MTLCWGGPMHNQIVNIKDLESKSTYVFPIPFRGKIYYPEVNIKPSTNINLQKALYKRKLFTDGINEWYVLVYAEKIERLIEHLEWVIKAIALLNYIYPQRLLWRFGAKDENYLKKNVNLNKDVDFY